MAMNAGLWNTAGSLAKEIYDNMATELGAVSGDLDTARKDFVKALAEAIVDHITNNAVVTTTITTSDSGLQRDPGDSSDCLAPSANKSVSGTVA